jgi:DNA-binding transcriptional regulator LsrR (DeoR family)
MNKIEGLVNAAVRDMETAVIELEQEIENLKGVTSHVVSFDAADFEDLARDVTRAVAHVLNSVVTLSDTAHEVEEFWPSEDRVSA